MDGVVCSPRTRTSASFTPFYLQVPSDHWLVHLATSFSSDIQGRSTSITVDTNLFHPWSIPVLTWPLDQLGRQVAQSLAQGSWRMLDLLARCFGMLNTSCSLWAVQANVARYFIISLVTYSLSQWKHVFFWTLTMNQEERKILPIGFWGTGQNKALLDAKCRAWGWFPDQSWVISYLKAD